MIYFVTINFIKYIQKQITRLDLSDNTFESIDFKDFSPLINLKDLNLKSSRIKKINNYKDVKTILLNLETIDITENNFDCNHLNAIIDELTKQNIILTKDLNLFNTTSVKEIIYL